MSKKRASNGMQNEKDGVRRWSKTSSETELRDRILREIGEKRKERGRKRETDRVGSWRGREEARERKDREREGGAAAIQEQG